MKDLLKTVEYVRGVAASAERGVKNLVAASPQLVKQHIEQLARRRLKTTREEYLSAVTATMTDYVLVVELDPDNWIANAVEEGADPFDMRKMLQTSSKAKLSAKGYKYMHIPMSKQKGGSGGPTDYGKDLQNRINQVLERPKFGINRLKGLINGNVVESQQVLSNDPMLKGLYRTRKFDSVAAYAGKQQRPAWQMVLFRTISENPESRSRWQHPGIKPVHIFKETEQWLVSNMPQMVESFVNAEIESFSRQFNGEV